MAGCMFIAGPGLGLLTLPEEETVKMSGMVKIWQTVADDIGLPLTIDATSFFLFVGVCKFSMVPALWGLFGSGVELLANICALPQLAGAVYTHHMSGEPLAPPAVFFMIATARLFLALTKSADDKAKAS
jgi:hypothetical protein